MTQPCDSKPEIDEMRKSLTEQGKTLAVVESLTDNLRQEMSSFIRESHEVINMLRELAIESKNSQKHFKDTLDVLFHKQRTLESRMQISENLVRDTRTEFIHDVMDKALAPVIKNLAEVNQFMISHKETLSDVSDLKTFKTEHDAGSKWMKRVTTLIPIICTLIVTAILIYDRIAKHATP